MQYKIPQDVQREDTIIGPITFAQLGIMAVGGSICYAIYISLANTYLWYVWAIPVALIGGLTAAVAFLKIGDMSFVRFLIYLVEYLFKPRNRYWNSSDNYYYSYLNSSIVEADELKTEQALTNQELIEKRKKLDEISKILDNE